MSRVRAAEVARLARAQIPVLEAEVGRIQQANAEHQRRLQQLRAEVARAWDYLATVLVPDLEAQHLDWGAQTLALPKLGSQAVQAAMGEERTRLQQTLRNLETDPTYTGREGILNACAIELQELTEAIAPLHAAVSACDGQLFFGELVDTGYGTDAYTGKWYTLSYYKHWKYGDMAVANLREELGIEDFGQLRARYVEHKAALEQLRASETELNQEIHAVQSVVGQHAEATRKLDSLPQRQLAKLRGIVKEHLAPLPRREIAPRLQQYDAGLVALKRVAGLEAKHNYFEAIHERWVAGPQRGVDKALRKAKRDAVKLLRPKYAYRDYPKAEIDRRFADRSPKWNKRWSRYERSRDLLWEFDDYDAFDLADDRPWWSAMTGDEVKARFIAEVGSYYQARAAAKAQSRPDDDAHDAAAVALAAQMTGTDDDFDDFS